MFLLYMHLYNYMFYYMSYIISYTFIICMYTTLVITILFFTQ